MKCLTMDHQFREESVSDSSLFAMLSVTACLDCLNIGVIF